jgi:hypothetical protein
VTALVLVTALVTGYLIAGAAVAMLTIGQTRRALTTGQSIALATLRVALAAALTVAVMLA